MENKLAHLFSTTYNNTEWFVPFEKAIKGLTEEQALQKQNNESIYGIVAHLTYWNDRLLKKLKGEALPPMETDNTRTFTAPDRWEDLHLKATNAMEAWHQYLIDIPEKDSATVSLIANTCTHNAYHVGQIITLRKLQGSWNPDEGVK